MSNLSTVAEIPNDQLVARIPPNYHSLGPRHVLTGENINTTERISLACAVSPVWNVKQGNKVWQAKKPIGISVRSEGQYYFAENDQLCIYATGFSAEEAITDFMQHLAHFIEYYRSLPDDKFTKDGLRMKRLFETVFG